jgi:hypothetical protein
MIPSGVGLDIVGIGINPLGLPSSSHDAAPGLHVFQSPQLYLVQLTTGRGMMLRTTFGR